VYFSSFINVIVNFVFLGNMSNSKDTTYQHSRIFTVFYAKCAFSQHDQCTLTIDGIQFQSALHYMLYQKASEYTVLHHYVN